MDLQDVAEEVELEQKETIILPDNVNLFASRYLNIAEDSVYWQDVEPSFMDDRPPQALYFDYPNHSNNFIDLSRTDLYLKLDIVGEDGQSIDQRVMMVENQNGNLVRSYPSFEANPVEFILQTMWKNVEIKFNGYSVYDSQQNYGYNAFFQYLLGTTAQTRAYQGSFMGWSTDNRNFDAVHTNGIPMNNGLVTRRNWRMKVAVGSENTPEVQDQLSSVEYYGPIFAGICNQERYLVNNVRIEIDFQPAKDSFRLMTTDGSQPAYLKIVEAKLKVCTVKLDSRVKVSIDNCMSLQSQIALYPLQKSIVRTFRANKGSLQFFENDMFRGKVPTKLVVGMISEEAYHGDYRKNPFYFQTFNISQIAVRLGNNSVPTKPLQLNFKDSDYLLGLISLYRVANRSVRDFDIGIDRDNYRQGLSLFGFNIDPGSHESSGLIGKPKYDLLQLVINFSKGLEEGVMIILYASFPDEVEVDNARVARVLSDIPS